MIANPAHTAVLRSRLTELRNPIANGNILTRQAEVEDILTAIEGVLANEGTNGPNDEESVQDILLLASENLSNLIPRLEIDPHLFYNPKDLPETDELVRNKHQALKSLNLSARLVRTLVDILQKLKVEASHNEAVMTVEVQCEVIYRLACWLSPRHSDDEWTLDEATRCIMKGAIDRLWELPQQPNVDRVSHAAINRNPQLASTILTRQIKPLFTKDASFSRNVNPVTGRKVDRQHAHLFETAYTGFDDQQIWKVQGIGLWNAMCVVLARLDQDSDFQVTWPLIIPPIITLLDESTPRYRLRGIQVSISLLENAPPSLICRTGIDSLLQRPITATFSLLNIPQTLSLLNSAFEANIKLIEVQWSASNKGPKDQAERYNRLNRLIEESVFNVLAFGKIEKEYSGGIDAYAIACLEEMVRKLGLATVRHLRVIMPYLCETLLNTTLDGSSWFIVTKINDFIVILFETCGKPISKWQSRLIVVLATCWLEWQAHPQRLCPPSNIDQDELSKRLGTLRLSTVNTLQRVVGGADSDPTELLDMMKKMEETHPLLKAIFKPILSH